MKIKKKADFDYTNNYVNEKTGYTRWFEKNKLMKKLNLFLVWARVLMIPLFGVLVKTKTQEIKNLEIAEIILLLVAVLCISVFVLLPLREIIRLGVLSGGRFNNKCVLQVGFGRPGIYNGLVDRKRIVITLLLPSALFFGVIISVVCLSWGVLQLLFQFLLIISGCIALEDLYLLVYCIKHLDKKDFVFGEYKKASG